MNDSKTSNDSGKSKHKKKVSFSIFEISTFDELAKLRKLREEELDDFVSNKKKSNQYLTNLNQRNKILSMSNNELMSFDNNDKYNPNLNNIISRNNNIKNINYNYINIPRPTKKEESSGNDSYFYNQENFSDALKNKIHLNKNKKKVVFSSDEEEDIKSNDIFSSPPQLNSAEKNEIIKDLDNIHSPIVNKDLITKENIFSPNSNDYNININNNAQKYNNIVFSENNENLENNEDEIPNDINEQNDNNENLNELITFKNNKNEIDNQNNTNNENKNENNINDINEVNNIDKENNNIEIPEEIDSKKIEQNITILFNLLERIFQISSMHKIELINEFFDKLYNFIEYQYDKYIDYENNDPYFYREVKNKSRLMHLNIYYNLVINNIKERIRKKKII